MQVPFVPLVRSQLPNGGQTLEMAYVRGTHGAPYTFGEPPHERFIEVADFWIATTPVTQALWTHVMGAGNNPAGRKVPNCHWGTNCMLTMVIWLASTPAPFSVSCHSSRNSRRSVSACLPRPSGNMRLAAARSGATAFAIAAVMMPTLSPGTIAKPATTHIRSPARSPTSWASSTCPATSGSGARTPTPRT